MPAPQYTGSPMGGGNPPGEHSEGYLKSPGDSSAHFVNSGTYRADEGRAEKENVVGNQPTKTESTIEKFSNKPSI